MQLKHTNFSLGPIRFAIAIAIAVAGAGCGTPAQKTTALAPPVIGIETLGAQQPSRVLHSNIIGRVDADTQIDFVLGLKLNDRTAVDRLIVRQADRKSSDFRGWLTPTQFADRFAPSAADYAAIAAAVTKAGLEVTRTVDGRTTMSVRGRAADIERLFGTELDIYRDRYNNSPATFRAPSHAFTIPAELSLVDSVVGLDTAVPWRSHMKLGSTTGTPSPAAGPQSQTPSDLRTRYNLAGAGNSGAGETLVILGAGMPPSHADIAGFVSTYSLAFDQDQQYAQILLGGPTREEEAEAENEYFEDVLDIDMAMTMAPAASIIHVIVAQNAGGLFGDGISFVVNQIPQAHQVTVSFGSCERAAAFSVQQTETLLAQGLAEGQTWFFSAGDNGADTCKDIDPGNPPDAYTLSVDYPASSAYVIGVGGTALTDASVEKAWGGDGDGGGGGGFSEIFPTPSWQMGVGPYQDQNARRVPDVAALAGLPGVNIFAVPFGGLLQGTEGTSAAAPMWGGIWSLIDNAGGGTGIADYHVRLYGLNGAGFNDITTGTNSPGGGTQGYPALVGYDLATGWGSPNVPALIGGL